MNKTFKELVENLYKERGLEFVSEDGEDILEAIHCWCDQVVRDEEDQHSWHINWRYVYELIDGSSKRYFAVVIPEGKGDYISWDDLDFEVSLDSFYEVYPQQVTTTIYK